MTDIPITPSADTVAAEAEGWSFLPPHGSGLAASKWSHAILEALSRRVGECVAWDEEAADIVRIAVGGIRERLVRAVLVCWRDGTFPSPYSVFLGVVVCCLYVVVVLL